MPRVGQHARAGPAPPGGLDVEVAGRTLGEALACVVWARRDHAVHLRGAVHRAQLVIDGTRHAPPSSRLLATPTAHEAVVRFSRSLGLARPLPDLLAMSLRVLPHFFGAASDVQQRVHSSSLPYRCGDATFLIGALLGPSSPRPAGPFTCGGGLWPIGVLNRLRDYAYPLAQHVWTARRRTGRRARGQAEPA